MKVVVIALLGLFSAAQSPAPAATPATYLSEAELTSALEAAAQTAPDMHTAAVKKRGSLPHQHRPPHETTRRDRASDGTEVHHVIEGSATFVGGTIVRPAGAGGRLARVPRSKAGRAAA